MLWPGSGPTTKRWPDSNARSRRLPIRRCRGWRDGPGWASASARPSSTTSTEPADDLTAAIAAFGAADNLPSKLTALLELATLEAEQPETSQFALDEARHALALADLDRSPFHACLAPHEVGRTDGGPGGRAAPADRPSVGGAHRAGSGCRCGSSNDWAATCWVADVSPTPGPTSSRRRVWPSRSGESSGTARCCASFPTETASCFDDLVELRLATGDVSEAFDAADRSRSRSLLDDVFRALGRRPGRAVGGGGAPRHL